jgi:hypothetical protein
MWAILHLPNVGSECYKLSPLTPDVIVSAMSCGAPVPHGHTLLGGSNTIYNDPKKSASHICAKRTTQFGVFLESLLKLSVT